MRANPNKFANFTDFNIKQGFPKQEYSLLARYG